MRNMVSLLGASLLPSVAQAQLGPIDGQNLSPTDLSRVTVGREAPDFRLRDAEGRTIRLSEFRGKKNVVLVFYRGHW